MFRAIGRSGGDALRRALASTPTAASASHGALTRWLGVRSSSAVVGATHHPEERRRTPGAMPWAASRSIATSSSSPMAKPGNIKEHALLRDWMFEDMGIAKPGSQPRKLRPGAIAVKCGMTAEWNEHGVRVPLTVLWIDDCRVRPSPSPRLPRVSPRPQPRSSRTRRASIAARPIDRSVNPRNTPSASSPPRAVRRHGRQQLTTFHPAPIAQVTQVKTEDKEGYTALQMGAGSKKAKRLSRQERGHFSSNELPFSAKLTEFRVSPDAILPVGTAINASHFAAGQHVDIQGHTIGKGFQGPMKRWGFSGLPASHGTTKKHRAHGSIGNSQDPGRVWKGKKMAGRMGNRKRTVQSVYVYKVDAERNLLYVKGQVPGKPGLFLKITDALRKPPQKPAYPTWGFGEFAEGAPSGVSVGKMDDPFITQSD